MEVGDLVTWPQGYCDMPGLILEKRPAKKTKKETGPVELYFDFGKLPDELRDALAEHARKKLRRTPAGFKKLLDSCAVDWNLSVRIDS